MEILAFFDENHAIFSYFQLNIIPKITKFGKKFQKIFFSKWSPARDPGHIIGPSHIEMIF